MNKAHPNLRNVQRLEEENQRLRRAVDELAILNDLALAIGGSLDSKKIMKSIIGRSIRALDAEQGDITLVPQGQENRAQTLVRSMVSTREHAPFHLNQNLLGWMQLHKTPLLINNPAGDERFRNVEWEPSIRSVLSAPLMVRSRLIGILTIYNKKPEGSGGFTESDQRLLSIIAAQSAQVVENARLSEEEQALRLVEKELELASSIQKKMLPSDAPDLNGYTVAGKNVTAQAVGGDYFDYIPMEGDRWAICLGDISGKGLPASLLMSNLQAILRGQVYHVSGPGEILRNANRQLYRSTSPEKFATLFLAVINLAEHTLCYSSAGHEYPFLFGSNGAVTRLKTGGLPLGMLDGQEYPEQTLTFEPGGLLFVYSDGITDVADRDRQMYGEQRLESFLTDAAKREMQPDELIGAIVEACLNHSGSEALFDDITAVALKRNS